MSAPTPIPPPPVSLAQARATLARLRPKLDDLVKMRADLVALQADLHAGTPRELGGVAEAKALEARVYAVLEEITASGAELKGWAPLLLDWPGLRDGVPVLWCWLEGEPDIGWYHRADCGFPGRRPV